MRGTSEDTNIVSEEEKTLKWFLLLFYIIMITFDLFYDYILPVFVKHTSGKAPGFTFYLTYICLFGLIFFVYYFKRKKKQYLVKYIYFISYTLLTLVTDVINYMGHPGDYKSGNAVEVLWLLLSPVFVSRPFFWLVSAGLLIRYILVGLIIHSQVVIFPMLMIFILSIFAYILLILIQSHVNAVKSSYDSRLEEIVKGIIATLELKDPYTRGHSERVASYALILAMEVGEFSKEELTSFNCACLLHDIGKIHIPDQILMKPSKLSNEEFEIIKSHPIVGAEAIFKVIGLKDSINVIRSHHERWDGKGYPDQLTGEEIPILARVTTIADAFDAMTSSRSYRAALSLEEAYKRVIEGQGTQFDPKLVEKFIKVFPSWKELHHKSNTHKQEVGKIVI